MVHIALWKHHNDLLTPKGLNVRTADKPVLVCVTWAHTIFRFFETFFEHASHSKLCGKKKNAFLGPTDQKLWMFEVSRRSLGRAGMCCNQWERVDHLRKKWRAGRKKNSKKMGIARQVLMSTRGRRATAGRWPALGRQDLGDQRSGLGRPTAGRRDPGDQRSPPEGRRPRAGRRLAVAHRPWVDTRTCPAVPIFLKFLYFKKMNF
jgi:hypothetical protein